MSIVISHLSYQYVEPGIVVQALSDLSFEIKEGAFWGIAGHTGSGKSTLVQHLNGLIETTPGHVIIDGHDVAN